MRKLITVAFGLCIAFAATSFFLPLFGFAGGAVF
jgi:type IV secretion system protein VirB2